MGTAAGLSAEIAKVHATQEALRRVEEYEFERSRARKAREHGSHGVKQQQSPFLRSSMPGVTISPGISLSSQAGPAAVSKSQPPPSQSTTCAPSSQCAASSSQSAQQRPMTITLSGMSGIGANGDQSSQQNNQHAQANPAVAGKDAGENGTPADASANFVAAAVGWVKGLVTPQGGRSGERSERPGSEPAVRTAPNGGVAPADLHRALALDPKTGSHVDQGLRA